MLREGWCLVLVIWGEKYSDAHVNLAIRTAKANSASLRHVVLFTDRDRPGIDPLADQRPFPEFFRRPVWFTHGYIAKLSMFSRSDLPPDMACVYVDLDTVIMGDLGRVAALVRAPNDYLMLPPGNLIGFGPLRRLIYKLTDGRVYAVGNSSVLAYSSAAEPNLCDVFQAALESGDPADPKLHIDDRFISWFAQARLRAIPSSLAVMFRREFLSRTRLGQVFKSRFGSLLGRRKRLVAITLNGMAFTPEVIGALEDGARISDSKGRTGSWSDAALGPAKGKITRYFAVISSAQSGQDDARGASSAHG